MIRTNTHQKTTQAIWVTFLSISKAVSSHLKIARLTYAKRSKIDPLYCQNVVGGFSKGQRYLSYVDLYGTKFENTHIVTGFARYFATPIIHNDWKPDMSEDEVKDIIKKCFKILFYRDCNAIDK